MRADHAKGLRELNADHPETGRRIVVSLDPHDRITEDGIELLHHATFLQQLGKPRHVGSRGQYCFGENLIQLSAGLGDSPSHPFDVGGPCHLPASRSAVDERCNAFVEREIRLHATARQADQGDGHQSIPMGRIDLFDTGRWRNRLTNNYYCAGRTPVGCSLHFGSIQRHQSTGS